MTNQQIPDAELLHAHDSAYSNSLYAQQTRSGAGTTIISCGGLATLGGMAGIFAASAVSTGGLMNNPVMATLTGVGVVAGVVAGAYINRLLNKHEETEIAQASERVEQITSKILDGAPNFGEALAKRREKIAKQVEAQIARQDEAKWDGAYKRSFFNGSSFGGN